MPVQTQIQTLYDASMALLNTRENKVPLHKNYLTDDTERLLGLFTLDINEPFGYAIRMGYNNVCKKTFISLDFDCCKKDEKKNKYVDCKNTQKLLDDYQESVKSTDGMFKSSTDGNYNVIVDITNSEDLIEILKYKPAVWSAVDCGLEILQYKIQCIPPTATKCKRSGIKNPRIWLSAELVYVVEDDDDPIVGFLKEYMERPAGKEKKNKYETKKLKESQKKMEDIEEEEQYILCKENVKLTEKLLTKTKLKELAWDYDSWWKMAYAIYNTHGKDAVDLFIKFSTNDKYRDKEAMIKYWNENVCAYGDKINKKYCFMKSWYIVKLLKNIDYENYIKYIEEIIEDLERYKLLEITELVEDPKGDIRLAKILYGGKNYLLYNKVEDRMDIVDKEHVEHTLFEKVEDGFLDKWFKSKTKKTYDKVDFQPYKKTPPNIYNTFQGFPHHHKIYNDEFKPNWGFINHFKEYCKRVCSNEDKACEFLEQNIAHICFKGRPNICIVIYGRQGAGKSSLTLLMKKLIGEKYCKDDYDAKNGVFKNFNASFQDKIMVVLNEPDWDSFSKNMGIFKHSITDETLRIEKKGVDSYDICNHATYWITTNNKNLFNQEKDDRRFFFVSCEFVSMDKDAKFEYFNDYYNNKLNNEEYICSVLWYLYNEVLQDKYNFEGNKESCLTEYHKIIANTYKDTDIVDWLCYHLKQSQAGYYTRNKDNKLEEVDGEVDLLKDDYWIEESCLYNTYKFDNDGSRLTSKDIFTQEIKLACNSNEITYRGTNGDGSRTKYIKVMGMKIKETLISKNKWVE